MGLTRWTIIRRIMVGLCVLGVTSELASKGRVQIVAAIATIVVGVVVLLSIAIDSLAGEPL